MKNERQVEESETATIKDSAVYFLFLEMKREGRKKEPARKGVRRQWVLSPTKEKIVKERDHSMAFRQKKFCFMGVVVCECAFCSIHPSIHSSSRFKLLANYLPTNSA